MLIATYKKNKVDPSSKIYDTILNEITEHKHEQEYWNLKISYMH